MSEITRYTVDANGELWMSNTGKVCLLYEVEALLKEKEEQLQQKDEEIEQLKEHIDAGDSVVQSHWDKVLLLESELTKHRELMDRMATELEEYNRTNCATITGARLLIDYQNLKK